MKKALFIAHRFHTNMVPYIKALNENDYECEFFAMYKGQSEDYSLIKPKILKHCFIFRFILYIHQFLKRSEQIDSIDLIFSSASILRFYIEIKRIHPDIVYIKGTQGSFFTINSLIACKALGIKSTVHIQTDIYGKKSRKKSIFIWIIRNIFGADVSSPLLGNKSDYEEEFDIGFLPFITDIQVVNKKTLKDIEIISIGKFVRRKNQLLLLKSFLELSKKHNNLRLKLIGEKSDTDYLNEIVFFIENNGINKKVELIFNISRTEVIDYLQSSSIFVLPSYGEPASVSLIEAMACGLPVISSSDNGTACYVENGINGYVFSSKNKESLSSRIELTIKNMNEMGKKSLEIIKNKYSNDVFIKYLNHLINEK